MGIRALSAALLLLALTACAQQPPAAEVSVSPASLPRCLLPHAIPQRAFIVFFDRHSADLTGRARTLLDELVQADRDGDTLRIFLAGNTDNGETGPRDRGLGARRMEAVRRYLEEGGIGSERIFAEDYGASRPLVQTAPGVPEPQNRRVDITPIGYGGTHIAAERRECFAWVRQNCVGNGPDQTHPSCDAALHQLEGVFP